MHRCIAKWPWYPEAADRNNELFMQSRRQQSGLGIKGIRVTVAG